MRAFQLIVEGNWAHFKRPETNNNPLTHDFITKTAFVGLIGAVLGKGRKEMRPLFPVLCENILYGVQVLNPVKKESWAFTMRRATDIMSKAPKHLEILKMPRYKVAIALRGNEVSALFDEFFHSIKTNKSIFTPVLGLHNCPASLALSSEGEFSPQQNGFFRAKCFVSNTHEVEYDEGKLFRIGLDRIPTFQNDNFWNLPDRYQEVIYPSEGREISANGPFYEYSDGVKWWLI